MEINFNIEDDDVSRHFANNECDFGEVLTGLYWCFKDCWSEEESELQGRLRGWAKRVYNATDDDESAKQVIAALAAAFEEVEAGS